MNALEVNSIQFDYFSENYKHFEDDFYQYADLNIPLTFLMDDILHALSASDNDYFILNKKHAKDHKDHYFCFERHTIEENENVVRYSYLGEKKG